MVLDISLALKMLKLDLYVYFCQKWAHVEETLMKLNTCLFYKRWWILEKYNEIWDKVKNSIKKEFDIKPVYNEKYLKAKTKSYNGKINKNFHNNKILREGSLFISDTEN